MFGELAPPYDKDEMACISLDDLVCQIIDMAQPANPEVGAVQADPGLKATGFSKFDCEKDITVLST